MVSWGFGVQIKKRALLGERDLRSKKQEKHSFKADEREGREGNAHQWNNKEKRLKLSEQGDKRFFDRCVSVPDCNITCFGSRE